MYVIPTTAGLVTGAAVVPARLFPRVIDANGALVVVVMVVMVVVVVSLCMR